MNKPSEEEKAFVRHLAQRLGVGRAGSPEGQSAEPEPKQRAARAALRRGLGKPPGSVATMYSYVEPWLGSNASQRQVQNYYTVAALMASHPLDWPATDWPAEDTPQQPSNFGASISRLAKAEQALHGDVPTGLERRFMAMLSAAHADLPEHLRHAVALLKPREVPVNWVQLLADLRTWDRETREVQRRWARAFWTAESERNEPELERENRNEAEEEDEGNAG